MERFASGGSGSGVFFPSIGSSLSAVGLNLSCQPGTAAESVPLSEGSLLGLRAVQSVLSILLFTLSIPLNTLLLFLVVKSKVLHKRTFYLALQIVVGNIIRSIVLFPPSVVTAITNQWVFGDAGCQVAGFIGTLMLTVRWLLMFVFSLDQFFTVLFPFSYQKSIGNRTAASLSATVWVVSLIISVLPLKGILDCYPFLFEQASCILTANSCGRERVCRPYSKFYYMFLTTAGGILPFILYLLLFIKAMQLKRRLSALTANHTTRPIITKSDHKGIVTFVLLLILLLGCSLPVQIVYSGVRPSVLENQVGGPIPTFVVYLSQIILFLSNSVVVVDAIILLRNPDVKTALKKLKCANAVRPL